jgi:spore coat polysaccharide biosynthesis protein SpsF
MRVVAIIQARISSTRLRGKVLLDLAGRTMLSRVIGRCRRAKFLREVVVATTTEPEDDAIVSLCRTEHCPVVRGSLQDLLDRYKMAADAFNADVIVRITSDCPMIDPSLIDQIGSLYLTESPVEYVTNTVWERTFPRGLDTEVISKEALNRAWREDRNPAWREHVTPYIYRNPELFRIRIFKQEVDLSALRWTVDTPEDYRFATAVYSHFGHDQFTWTEVLQAVQQHPEWSRFNEGIVQKTVA